jgi:pimeloyl-ACP methyl ester carboxylesterase
MKCLIKNVSINYEVYGEGKPMLAIHGWSVDHRLMAGCMEPVFESKPSYKRIYVDLPGMGETKAESWITGAEDILDLLIEFIDAVIPGENFLLAGESFGGYLARGIVHKLSDKVDGLFLLCPSIKTKHIPRAERDLPAHVVLKQDNVLLTKLEPLDAKAFNAIQVLQTEGIWERYRNEILFGIKIADFGFLNELKSRFSFDLNKVEKSFSKPTLFLMGRQDSYEGYKDAWTILERYPRATFAVIDRAGHNLQIEQPEIFNSLMGEWLNAVEEFR